MTEKETIHDRLAGNTSHSLHWDKMRLATINFVKPTSRTQPLTYVQQHE
jgi:hypothetical protein